MATPDDILAATKQRGRDAADTTYSTVDPQTGIAPCCNDPANRRTSTIDPARVAAARGGTPGVQVCAVCQRRHYTFAPDPVGTVRPNG